MSKTTVLEKYLAGVTTLQVVEDDLSSYDIPSALIELALAKPIQSVDYWFYASTPKPTSANLISQLKIHYEEVNECTTALEKLCEKIGTDNLTEVFISQNLQDPNLAKEWDELVDAFGDQIVTSIGMLRFLGCDPSRVISNIAVSNLSKFEDGVPYRKVEGGKILKGKAYKKVDLTFAVEAIAERGKLLPIVHTPDVPVLYIKDLLKETGPQ